MLLPLRQRAIDIALVCGEELLIDFFLVAVPDIVLRHVLVLRVCRDAVRERPYSMEATGWTTRQQEMADFVSHTRRGFLRGIARHKVNTGAVQGAGDGFSEESAIVAAVVPGQATL